LEGQDVFWRLVDRADVVLDNLASDAMQRYGLGYDSIHARKPAIVYAALGAFAEGGPWSGRRGHENQGQCVTGMMDRYGGDGPPLMQAYLVNDIGTGVFSAFGAMLGLYQRLQSGEGCFVRATLTQTATLHQAPYMLDYKGKVWDEPRGLDARGWGLLQRMYQAQDGWFFVGASARQIAALDGVEGLGGTGNLTGDQLGVELERRFAAAPRETWVARLQAAGIGSHALLNLIDLVNDPTAQQQGSVYYEARGESKTPMSAPAPRLSGTPIRGDLPVARMPGIDAPSILQDLGIGDRLQELIDAKVIRVPDPNTRPARG
jgi:crotonobetainyl-CoA:carnitine CoA-transferase CaiB-like acyl-CoA transferase